MTIDDETLNLIEHTANAALDTIPEPYKSERWQVGNTSTGSNTDLLAVETRDPADGDVGFIILEDCEQTGGVLDRPTAEHIALMDPHLALALVVEIRRLRAATPPVGSPSTSDHS